MKKIISVMAILLMIVPLSTATNAKTPPPVPEPKVTEIKFSNSNPVEGEEIWINATINSTIDIANVTVLFLYDDYPLGAETVNLTNGATTVGIRWKAVAWEHEIKVQLAIGENPILNSTASEKIYVLPKKIGSTINVIIAIILTCFAVAAVAVVPSLREWFRWKRR